MRGFTLVEMLFVVAIIGILASIAVPSYLSYVERSQISEGRNALQQARATLEGCFSGSADYSYTGCDAEVDGSSETGVYGLTVTISDEGDTYRVVAAANDKPAKAGDCGRMRVDDDGARTPTTCWDR